MAAARLSSHDPESGGCCLCSSPLSFHSGTGSERPGAVQGAPLFGAAERTLDGEDRSEIITEGRKGACFRLLRTHYRPIIPPSFGLGCVTGGGPGLLWLGLADNSLIPLPGSMDVLTIWFAVHHRHEWLYYAAMAAAGSVIGGYATYRLARKGGKSD